MKAFASKETDLRHDVVFVQLQGKYQGTFILARINRWVLMQMNPKIVHCIRNLWKDAGNLLQCPEIVIIVPEMVQNLITTHLVLL